MQHFTKWSNLTFFFWGLCSKRGKKKENHKIQDGFSWVQSLCSLGAYRETNIHLVAEILFLCFASALACLCGYVPVLGAVRSVYWLCSDWRLCRSSPPSVLPCLRPARHCGLLHHGVRRPTVLRLPGLADVSMGHRHRHGQTQVHHQAGTTARNLLAFHFQWIGVIATIVLTKLFFSPPTHDAKAKAGGRSSASHFTDGKRGWFASRGLISTCSAIKMSVGCKKLPLFSAYMTRLKRAIWHKHS